MSASVLLMVRGVCTGFEAATLPLLTRGIGPTVCSEGDPVFDFVSRRRNRKIRYGLSICCMSIAAERCRYGAKNHRNETTNTIRTSRKPGD